MAYKFKGVIVFLVVLVASFNLIINQAWAQNGVFENGGFESSCFNLGLNNTVLTAECSRIDGSVNQQASIDLNSYIGNDNGSLIWAENGNFGGSCSNLRFLLIPPPNNDVEFKLYYSLGAKCLNFNGTSVNTLIKINARIANIDGTLIFQ